MRGLLSFQQFQPVPIKNILPTIPSKPNLEHTTFTKFILTNINNDLV